MPYLRRRPTICFTSLTEAARPTTALPTNNICATAQSIWVVNCILVTLWSILNFCSTYARSARQAFQKKMLSRHSAAAAGVPQTRRKPLPLSRPLLRPLQLLVRHRFPPLLPLRYSRVQRRLPPLFHSRPL